MKMILLDAVEVASSKRLKVPDTCLEGNGGHLRV